MVNWRRLSWYRPGATTALRLRPARIAAACAFLVTACGHAGEESPAPAGIPANDEILCAPSDEGMMQARLQGLIEAEIDWSANHPQCRGGPRQGGDGIRLIYKGTIAADEPVVLVVELVGGTTGTLGLGKGNRVVRVDAGWPRDARSCASSH